MKLLQTAITVAYGVKHAANEEKTEDQTRRHLSLVVEDLVLAFFFRADVDEHDDEEKEDHHAADVNEYLHAGDELRAGEHKQRRHGDERGDQKQRAVHGIARHHRQQPRKDRRQREDPEEERFVTGESHSSVADFGHKKAQDICAFLWLNLTL